MQFLDFTTKDIGMDVSIEQVRISETSEVVSKTIKDLQLSRELGVIGAYPDAHPCRYEVRAFVPGLGVPEDPVTGSLNAGLHIVAPERSEYSADEEIATAMWFELVRPADDRPLAVGCERPLAAHAFD